VGIPRNISSCDPCFLVVAFIIVHVVLVAIFRTRSSRDRGRRGAEKRNDGRVPVIKFPGYPAEAPSASSAGGSYGTRCHWGGLALLPDATVYHSGVDAALKSILRFDDKVQAALFSGQRLAQTYSPSAVTRPFASTPFTRSGRCAGFQTAGVWSGGSVSEKAALDNSSTTHVAAGRADHSAHLHRGWSQIGRWSGWPLRAFFNGLEQTFARPL